MLALCAAILLSGWAHGLTEITVNNFQLAASPSVNTEITHYDTSGNAVDAHAGNILQVGNTFYLYGHSDSCGYSPGTAGTAWCGVKVYSSADLKVWTYDGYLFDGSTTTWQTNCAPQNNNFVGCYSPKMLYNAKNNNYVLWFFGETASPSSSETLFVFTCTSPTGGATPSVPGTGCTQQPNATFPTVAPEAPSFFVDGSGNAYAAYTDLANGEAISVIALNSDFTNATGSATAIGQNGEGNFIFEKGGTTYVGYGSPGCAYCASATFYVVSASSPLGSYGSPTTLNANSCFGQPRDAFVANLGGQPPLYIALTDQWWALDGGGHGNQGFANFYLQPLTFSGGAAQAFSCAQTINIFGPPPSSYTSSRLAGPDGFFRRFCGVLFHSEQPLSTANFYSNSLGSSLCLAAARWQQRLVRSGGNLQPAERVADCLFGHTRREQ